MQAHGRALSVHLTPAFGMDRPSFIPAKPFQPQNVIFPKRVIGKSVTKAYLFQAKWFDTWRCLHWDDGKRWVFCHVCAQAWHSRKITFLKNSESSFITKGFQNWKDATRIFRDHEKFKYHAEAVEKEVKLPTTTPDVGSLLVTQLAEDKRHDREILLHILQLIRFLARQGLPL